MKRYLALVLAVMMLFTCLPLTTFATQTTISVDLPVAEKREITTKFIGFAPATKSSAEYGTLEEAVAAIRKKMVARSNEFFVYGLVPYSESTTSNDLVTLAHDLLYEAMEHTGVADEGDYIRSHYDGGRYGISYSYDSQWFYVTFRYYPNYSTTADQETATTAAVEALLPQLQGATDYETVCNVYDWLTDNVTYDYANLEDDAYVLKYSAYAALVDKTAVCQGYATALYRLLLELGVECRMVSGTADNGEAIGSHAWNTVKLGSKYYLADSTWDATYAQAGYDYVYFLKGSTDFDVDHFPKVAYTNVSATDYIPGTEEDTSAGLRGDVNPDGVVDLNDFVALARHLGLVEEITDSDILSNADVTGDSVVDLSDFVKLAQYLGNVITDLS